MNMQAVLKGLHSADVANVETYIPDEDDKFGFVFRAMVGPMNGEGAYQTGCGLTGSSL
jgi:hypothetical protein